ncbi:unnamed protein product [Rotaria socialis]|uniref:VWFA domain-containing protein n=2 Tax=Rotaria socialis TaxID=392032 RepID=A0A821PWV2_9BILA|nr:unnamed protein product [Rotaria socialis]CAF4471910.1 unnamed protein product [Rotaria socialis]CAF4814958.1 unnamed protein product [Rotaria socialis]
MIESGEILNNSLAATHRIQPAIHMMNTLNALASYQKALECSHQEKSPSHPKVSNLQNDADACLTYSMVGHLLEEQRNPSALSYYEHALEIGLKLKTKMANLTEMLTNSQVGYSHESDAASSVDALSITYCDDTATTKSPVQPESAQTSKLLWIRFILLFAYFDCFLGMIFYRFLSVGNHSHIKLSFSNVKDPQTVNQIFSNPPRGYTPLVSALQSIFQLPATRRGYDKKVLVFIATDGAPTDDYGNINVQDLEHVMNVVRQIETTHVMFLICTDDSTCVDYLNEWKNTMANVDVTDDYRTERDKAQRKYGLNAPFSIGDYIVKALVGAIDPNLKAI